MTTASSDSTSPSVKKTLTLSRTPSRQLTKMRLRGLSRQKKRKSNSRSNGHKRPREARSAKLTLAARLRVVAEGDGVEGVVEGMVEGVVEGVAGEAGVEEASRMAVQKNVKLRTRTRSLRRVTSVRGLSNRMGRLTQASEETLRLLLSKLPKR